MKSIGFRLVYAGLVSLICEIKSATHIELGDTVFTNVARSGAKVFTFSGYKNQVISVRAAIKPSRTGPRLRFQLFSPEEAELLATISGRPSAELNQFTLTSEGPHTLILFDESGTWFDHQIAGVTIVDNQVPDESLRFRDTVVGTFQVSDIDVYSFEGRTSETAVLSIRSETSAGLEPNVIVISPSGETIATLESVDGSIETASVELPLTGSYSMLVRDKSGIAEGDYSVSLNIQVPEDEDFDGLKDSWEHEVFGDLRMNGTDDVDLDGVDNRIEFVRGTNPLIKDTGMNHSSPLLSISVGTIDIEFTASRGGRYQLEGSSDFVEWIPLGRAINGDNQTVRRSFSVPEAEVKYFRLVYPD